MNLRLGIIGCGGMGKYHSQMATNCGLKIVACADPVKSKAEALAGQYKADATANGGEIINRNDVDIVLVATPTPTHRDYVVAAAKAGKHIFCEKPFCRTVAQCQEAVEAVEKAGVKLFVGHVVRYFQEFETIKSQMDAGHIGKPGFIKMYRGGIWPRGEGNWFRDIAQSGGVAFDCAIHDYDWLRYAFGNPAHVFCQAIQNMEEINYGLSTFRMESGLIAHVIATWAQPAGFRVKVEVAGETGLLQYDSADAPISSMMRAVEGSSMAIVPASPMPISPYQLEWRDFLGWINSGQAPKVRPEDAIWAVKMASGVLESAEKGCPIQF